MRLTEKDSIRIQAEFHIPITSGYGMGLGGSAIASFRENLILSLDEKTALPTDEELELICSYRRELVTKMYRRAEDILAMEFPAIEGHNTTILIKGSGWPPNGEEGWACRRMTWTQGASFFPSNTCKPPPPYSLKEVIDWANRIS